MRSSLLLALGLNLAVAAGAPGGDDKSPRPPKDGYVKVRVEVEVRGVLHQTDKGFTVSSRLKVYQLHSPLEELPQSALERPADVYDLDFARAKELRERAETLKDKEVVVTGTSELRMVDQAGQLGAGSGFGNRQPSPGPTWSLLNTVLVTGLKSAGTADVAPTVEPKADGDKGAGMTYDGPQAVFDAAVAAQKLEDARTWIGCLAPEIRKEFASRLAYAAVVAQHLVHDHPKLKGAGQFQPLLAVLNKYGLTYDVTKNVPSDPDAGADVRRKAVADLNPLIKDPTGLAADLVQAYSTGGELSHHKPEDLLAVELQLEPLKNLPEPKLIEVKIDGDKAAGFIFTTINGAEMRRPIDFLKAGGGWWVALSLSPAAEEPGAPAARPEQERLQGAWMLMEPVSLSGASPPRTEPYSPVNWDFIKEELRFSYNLSLRSLDQTEFGAHAAYRLDPDKAPKQIDLAVSEGKWAGKNLPGIYLLEGDVLIVALSTEEKKRPREFTNGAKAGQRLLVFRRDKRDKQGRQPAGVDHAAAEAAAGPAKDARADKLAEAEALNNVLWRRLAVAAIQKFLDRPEHKALAAVVGNRLDSPRDTMEVVNAGGTAQAIEHLRDFADLQKSPFPKVEPDRVVVVYLTGPVGGAWQIGVVFDRTEATEMAVVFIPGK